MAIAACALLSTLIQLVQIIRKKVHAPKISWVVWALIGVAILIINVGFNGWDATSKMLAAYFAGNLLVVGYILLHADYRGWTTRDRKILIAVGVILMLWVPFKIFSIAGGLLWATVFAQLLLHGAHFIGIANHWKKVWSDPFTESETSWIFRMLSGAISLYVLQAQNQPWVTKISPIYVILTIGILLPLIFYRRMKLGTR